MCRGPHKLLQSEDLHTLQVSRAGSLKFWARSENSCDWEGGNTAEDECAALNNSFKGEDCFERSAAFTAEVKWLFHWTGGDSFLSQNSVSRTVREAECPDKNPFFVAWERKWFTPPRGFWKWENFGIEELVDRSCAFVAGRKFTLRGKGNFFQYFQMKEIYFLTLQRPDCLRSSRPWRK